MPTSPRDAGRTKSTLGVGHKIATVDFLLVLSRYHLPWGTDSDTLTISWTERDGPPVSRPKRRGFGTMVTKEMAERSLKGNVDLDYAPSGATWRLTCPAANALEHRQPAEIA
jgi:two-component sensor histidine kinase